jgi:circadian clock protein KaiC
VDSELTGIAGLDRVTGGLPPNGLTILIGAPGTGKTVVALQIAMNHAQQGKDVIFFSAFSESPEKVLAHLHSFSFFNPELVGERIMLLSLKATLLESVEETLDAVLHAARGKNEPLIIIDGLRGLYGRLGPIASQDLLAGLSSRMPYYHGRAVITSEVLPSEHNQFFELSSADALISISQSHEASKPRRTFEIYKIRGHAYLEGTHGLEINAGGVVVYPRLATCLPEVTPSPTARRLQFGLPEFDSMLGGGLPEFSTTAFIGDLGTGRTTFSMHFLLAGALAGERGMFVALGDTQPDILEKADELRLPLRELVDSGYIQILEVPLVELDPYRFAWRLAEMLNRNPIQRVVLDSATNLESVPAVRSAAGDYLTAISLYLRRTGITTVLTADASRYGTASPGWDAVHMPAANNRVLLRRVAFEGRFYRVCSVLNMQRSDHDTRIREFIIGAGGIRMLPNSEAQPRVLRGIERDQPGPYI